MSSPITPKQLHILQHSQGLDRYGEGSRYRNHFVTGPGSCNFSDCMALVEMGLMKNHGSHSLIEKANQLFTVTKEGEKAIRENSPPPPPPPTRSQRNYNSFLSADCGNSFAEWIGADERMGHRMVYDNGSQSEYRYYSPRLGVTGEWRRLKKDAKASYKAAKAEARNRRSRTQRPPADPDLDVEGDPSLQSGRCCVELSRSFLIRIITYPAPQIRSL